MSDWFPSGALASIDGNMFATGLVAPTNGPWVATQTALTASRAYIIRLYCPRPLTVTKIAFALGVAAGSNDNCDAGIYDASLNRLASAGSTAGKLNASAPSVQSLTLTSSLKLAQGAVYYLAFACSTVGSSAAQVMMTAAAGNVPMITGAAAPNLAQGFQAAAFPLAATFTPSASQITGVPILAALA